MRWTQHSSHLYTDKNTLVRDFNMPLRTDRVEQKNGRIQKPQLQTDDRSHTHKNPNNKLCKVEIKQTLVIKTQ